MATVHPRRSHSDSPHRRGTGYPRWMADTVPTGHRHKNDSGPSSALPFGIRQLGRRARSTRDFIGQPGLRTASRSIPPTARPSRSLPVAAPQLACRDVPRGVGSLAPTRPVPSPRPSRATTHQPPLLVLVPHSPQSTDRIGVSAAAGSRGLWDLRRERRLLKRKRGTQASADQGRNARTYSIPTIELIKRGPLSWVRASKIHIPPSACRHRIGPDARAVR